VKRFIGMCVTFAVLIVVFAVLGGAFYGLAALLGRVFGGQWGIAYAPLGVAIANVLTMMLVVQMVSASLLTVAERKWAALIQNRIGANRIKVFGNPLVGIPFLIADAVKMLTKERFVPATGSKLLFNLAPILTFVPVFVLFAVVPVGPQITIGDVFREVGGALGAVPVSLQVASPDAGLLYVFAISSMSVFGTSLAGWASNNKYALLGGVRASSQMISYEVSLGLSLVGMMIAFHSLRLEELVVRQGMPVLGGLPALGILVQPLGFLVFFASSFAETKRAPFDLPEGESEIVGFFIEYSGMQWGLMFLAEFIEIVVLAGITTAIFLGGWHPILFEGWLKANLTPFAFSAVCVLAFILKMVFLMWLQLVIRWLLPRFRYDQVQKLCWKILLPTSLANVFITGAAVLIDPSLQLLAWIGVAVIAVIVALTAWSARAPAAAAEHGHGHAHAAAGH